MRFLLPVIFMFSTALYAQPTEQDAVFSVIKKLFDGMRAGDGEAVRSVFHPSARLQTTYTGQDGRPVLKSEPVEGFVEAVGKPREQVWDERLWSIEIQVDDNLATVWTEYTFFVDNITSHCGVNAFQLFKDNEGWKIIQITDTRRRVNCQTAPIDETARIAGLLDNWHAAAESADEELFFGSMAFSAVYLGTDATEKWKRDELRQWSEKYFEGESAWSFKATDREIYLSKSRDYAWFDELLDTWMGPCRGSGVVQRFPEGWKIMHYNLSVMVPNEKMDAFLQMMKNQEDGNKD